MQLQRYDNQNLKIDADINKLKNEYVSNDP